MEQADVGVIGLAVMGRNLALNLADRGFTVAVFNRTAGRLDELLRDEPRPNLIGHHDLAGFVAALKRPRVCLLMVQAGAAVDAQIGQLLPLLSPGDIVIDGGNSLWEDSSRRVAELAARGLHFVGMGVSGGEEGARRGPSLMPGGDPAAWPALRPMFEAIAAQVDGTPCCAWIGDGGAGHYVKMVHNGIEYGDMQLIGEAYQLLREGLGLDADALAETFEAWNAGPLSSYLIEITAAILRVRAADGRPLIDDIVDSSGQKGTGKWTAVNALELGVPLTLIGEAVNSRFLSALRDERLAASTLLDSPGPVATGVDLAALRGDVEGALYCSKMVSYAQGFMLLRAAAAHYGWRLAYGAIAMVWRGGCIIRSRFLEHIDRAYRQRPDLPSLLVDGFFAAEFARHLPAWRRVVAFGVARGIPLPAFSAALAFFDGYRSARLPANLLQAQRDYFGAHTYQRVDADPARRFHFDWTGPRGEREIND